MSQELKPCPFCGQEQADGVLDVQPSASPFALGATWAAGCYNCGTVGPWESNEASAAKAWNTRPTPEAKP